MTPFVRACSVAVLLTCAAVTLGAESLPTIGTVERLDPKFDDYVPKDAKIEKLAEGFKWAEGPTWVKDGAYLLFSDVPNNVIHRWSADKGISDFLKPSGYTGKEPPTQVEP